MKAISNPIPIRVKTGGRRSERWSLAGLSLSMLMSSLDTSIANAGLPTLAGELHASFAQVQWIVLAYLLAVTTTIVGVGHLGDLAGRRRLLFAGTSVFIAASILCGLAPSLWALVAARAAQGLGAAVMMALTIAFVGDLTPKEKIGSAMGLLGTMSAIGTAVGPSLGGFLISCFGWPSIFWVNVPVGLLSLGLAQRHLPPDRPTPRASRRRFDVTGMALLAVTLAAYALAMTLGEGQFGPVNGMLLLAALFGLGLFVGAEARAQSPLVSLDTFRMPMLTGGLAMSGLVSAVIMSTLVVGPFYLSRGLGLSTGATGLALSVGPVVVVLMGVPAGRISDRFGAQRTTVLGLGAVATGSLLLSLTWPNLGILGYLGPIAIVTAGYSMFQTSNNASVMAGVSPERRGLISGMLGLSRNLGLITGASLMGTAFAFASGAADIATAAPESVGAGMRFTFALATGMASAALWVALRGRRTGREA